MKKILAGLIASILILTASGCTNNNNSNDGTSNTKVTTTGLPNALPPQPEPISTNGENKVTVDGTKFMVNGKEIWFNGANTPWDNWNDFGGNFEEEFWDTHFQELHDAGINASRIWISCNGDVGMIISSDGTVDGATTAYWEDLDTLFALAEKHEIYIMATLMSFDHFKDSNNTYMSWRTMVQDSEKIDQYVNSYVIPLAKRYDNNDYLWSIDLCNEPDWVIENEECGKLSWDAMGNYFSKAAVGIHENSDVLVTVGFGIVKYNSDLSSGNMGSDEYLQSFVDSDSAYLDFYSTHYYDWQEQWFGYPFVVTPVQFKLDGTKPCVIGECAANSSKGRNLVSEYESAYTNGWNGVFAWTSNGIDACGGFDVVSLATLNMLEIAEESIFPNK